MPFAVVAWNVDPNIDWFAKFTDEGAPVSGECLVGLYLTSGEASAGINRMASGRFGYGASQGVSLSGENITTHNSGEYANTWGKYYSDLDYHLLADGYDGDSQKVFKIKQFTDLDEIRDPIYSNANLITSRGTAELEHHTNAIINIRLPLGDHKTSLEIGSVVRFNSTRRGQIKTAQVMSHTIAGEVDENGTAKLNSEIVAAEYLELTR